MTSSEKKINAPAAAGQEAAAGAEEEIKIASGNLQSRIEAVRNDQTKTPEQRERDEFDLYIELAILSHACQKHSEGGAGVIMRLNLGELSADVRENLLQHLPALSESETSAAAFKYLKIYTVGIHNEYALQKQAHDIIAASELADRISVPRPINSRATKLYHAKTIEKLSQAGVRVSREVPDISYETMDFIEGADLEVHFARQLIGQRPDLFARVYPDGDLEKFLGSLDNYNVRSRLKLLFAAEEAEATFADQDKFFEFLKKRLSFSRIFPREQLEQLKSAIKLLHEQGFYHRDLHLRNIMIDQQGKLYLIDFDRSAKIDPADRDRADQIYLKPAAEDQITKYLSDSWIIDFLTPLTKGKEEQASEALRATENELGLDGVKRIKKLAEGKSNPRLTAAWAKMISGISEGQPIRSLVDNLSREMGVAGNWQESYNFWMAVLLEAAGSGRSEEVINYCQEMIFNDKTSDFVRSKMNRLIDYLNN